VLLRNNEPFGWQMSGFGKRRFHKGEGYSDHLPILSRFTKKPFVSSSQKASDATVAPQALPGTDTRGGFETSMEGWLACSQALSVVRDSSTSASGRYSLSMKGDTCKTNCCAARTVLRREIVNRPRWTKICLDLRGTGKLSVRIRSGKGRWHYYNGPSFAPSGSARYLPLNFAAWKHIVLPFTYDKLASPDLAIEIRAGKDVPFCFYLDNVDVK